MKSKLKTIWFAGGCFWGVEAFFSMIPGVYSTETGYANGNEEKPHYREIARTGHAEAVKIVYDPEMVNLGSLVSALFDIIDPTSVNRQGNDIGTQYRTGIYFEDVSDRPVIEAAVDALRPAYSKPLAVEISPLRNYYAAEEYHQRYLEKNPGGYCHVDFGKLPAAAHRFKAPSKRELKEKLSPLQYSVTQENATEPPFENEFWESRKKGIYVDITTGEPLFVSSDKFESGCGWPAFSKPISPGLLRLEGDFSHGMTRTEVRSRSGNAHLGHVFRDGPPETGGLRYCINSASLRFIPKEDMAAQGYGDYLQFVL